MVTLYSKPGCPPCAQTKAHFLRLGIEFVERDVTEDPTALATVKDELKYSGVPVVVVDETTHWVGYDSDRIDSLA